MTEDEHAPNPRFADRGTQGRAGLRSRRSRLFVLACIVLGVSASGGVAVDGAQPAPREPARADGGSSPEQASGRDARQTSEQREERRATRRRFSAQNADEALTTARHYVPPAVTRGPFRPFEDRRAVRFIGSRAAVVGTGDEQRTLMVSSAPLGVPDGEGKLVPLDLSLVRSSADFASRRQSGNLRIPVDLGDGVELGRPGLVLRPAGADQAAAGEALGGSVFYANAHVDTDFAVRPTPDGVEVFDVLRSDLSPESLRYTVDGDGEPTLRESSRHAGLTEVVRDGRVVATLAGVMATDADGVAVETTVRVADKKTLEILVPHRGKDVRYPITVDPEVTWDNYWWESYDVERHGPPGGAPTGWRWEQYVTSGAGMYPHWGTNYLGWGLHIWRDWYREPTVGEWYNRGDMGQWVYASPGDSSIGHITADYDLDLAPGEPAMCVLTGLQPANTAHDVPDMQTLGECGDEVFNRRVVHETTVDSDNQFMFRLRAPTDATRRQFAAHLQYVNIHIYDRKRPELLLSGGWTTSGHWTTSGARTVTATDTGTGVEKLELTKAPTVGTPCDSARNGDAGVYDNNCAARPLTTSHTYPEGATPVTAVAEDVVELTKTASTTFRVDATAPLNPVFTTLGARPALGPGTSGSGMHGLPVTAADDRRNAGLQGGAAADVSGARNAAVTLDGTYGADLKNAACSSSTSVNCTITGSYPIDASAASALGRDDFRPPTGTVDGRSAQIGGTWSRSSVGTDITVTTAGRIRRTQANRAWASIATPGPTADYDVGADVVSLPTAGSGNLGVLGRFTSATGNYYSAKWDNADSRWELRRVLDGQATVLGTASDTLPAGSTARLTLQMRGSTIRLLRDGAAKVTAIDAAVTAPGRAGVYFEGSTSGSDTAGRHLDNFDVTKSALTEGRHVLSAKTTDGVGKTSAGLSRDVIVDRTSPDLIVVEGTLKRTRIGRGKYTLDVTARDRGVWPDVAGMGRIDILVNGVVAHTDDRDDPGIDHTTRFEFDTATREKGSYRFDVRAYDAAKSPSSGDGNAFDEETFTVNFDDDAKPDVSLSGSATDPFNPGSQLNVAANDRINAQDGSGVEKIEVKVDGVRDGDLHERPCPNAQCPQTWELTHTLNAGAYTEGTHTVKASATDAAGNVGDSMEFAWRVDRTAPTVEHAPLEHVDGWRNEAAPTAKSRVTGRDGGGGVRSVEVTMPWETNGTIGSRTDAHPFPCASGLVSCQPAASHDFTYSPALRESGGRLPEGRLTFRARAADVGGRQSGEAIWSYRVDRGSPKLAPVTGSVVDAATHRRPVSGPEFLNVSATDGENTTDATRRAGVASAELIVDGQPLSQAVRDAMAGEQRVTQECPGDSCSLSTQLTFDPAHVAEGDHALKARVTDHAGNLTESQTYVVIVDRNAPTVEQSPVSGVAGWHRASDPDATVRVTGRDAGSGVRALTVAGPWQTSPSAPVTEGTLSHTPPCTGPAGRCPAEVTHDFTFGPGVSSAGQIPEGRNAMRATATDGGNRGSADVTWTYRVDRSAPELAPVSGSLVDAVNDGRPLSEPEVMDVSASDGANTSDASRRSGVASAELIVDGRELTQTERDSMTGEQRATQDCPADSCALATQLTFDPTELPEGDHTVKVRVIDHAGNASESQQYGLIVDRNAPTVEESPVSGVDGWNAADDADATVRVTGRDAGAGVRLLTVAGPWQTSPNASITEGTLSHAPPCPGPAGRCPTEVTHDFTFGPGTSSDGQIPEGRNTMRATATDGGGRGSADVTWTYRVDREAPSDLMVDGPLASADDRRFGSATTLNVQATDGSNATDRSARSGVEVTELLLDGEPMSDAMRAAMQGEQRHTQSCPADSCGIDTQLTFDPGALDPGVYRVKVRVTDHAGNSTESAEYIAYTDTTAPAVELSGSATQPVNPGPLLHVHADDHVGGVDGTGVQSIEVKVDGVRDGELHERTCPAAGCPQAWDLDHSLDTTRYSEGLHEVSVTATDAAGNAGEAATRQVYVTQLTAVDRSKLGLEDFLHYESTATGAGSRLHVNGANGNGVWHSTPVVNPGRGLSSVVNLTYNAQDRGGVLSQALSRGASPLIGATLQDLVGLAYGEAGHGFSLGISGVTRLNEPLGGALTANTTGVITLTDPDGTAHRFTGGLDGVFDEPKGVHLQLRRYASLTDVTSKRYWAATRPDGVTFFFDFTGYASSVEDRNGNVIRFDYERYSKIDGTPCPELDPLPELVCAKRVVRVVDPVGVDAGVDDVARNARSIRVTYRPGGVLRLPEGMDPAGIPDELAHIGGDAGRIASIRDHAGRLTEFTYDGDGYLTRLTQGKLQGATSHPDERSFELGYTGSGPNRVLHTVEDPNGHTSTIDYEALAEPGLLLTTRSIGRRVKWSEDRREARKDYAYAARSGGLPGTSFTVTDPALENETARRARSAQLDYQARPVELVDGRGTSTQLVWDEGTEFPDDNNVTTLVEAAGTADAATSTMKYNEHGQLTEQTDPLGRTSDLDYFTATAGTHIAPSGNDVGQAFVSDLEQITPPKGNWTKFTLDGAGNVTSKQVKDQPAAITTYGTRGIIASEKDEVGNVTQYQDHEANGLPRRTIDPRNHHWTYQYDAVGNVLKATDPRGSDTAAENDFAARITYDAFDRVTQTVTPKRSQHSEFVTRTSDYDGNGNLIERVDGEGESTLFGFTVMDEPSRQESAPAPHYGQQDASREVTTSEYDTLGRIRRRIAPNGDGGVEGDFETTFTYSAADELLVERRKAHANDQNTPAELVTSMAYDRRGNVVGVADARRNASAGAGADPVALAANPNARRWTYVYDLADNREEAIEDPGAAPKKSLRTTFTYDDNDNVETQTSPRGHAEERVSDFTTTFGHDTNDLVTSIQHKERLTTFERRDLRADPAVAARQRDRRHHDRLQDNVRLLRDGGAPEVDAAAAQGPVRTLRSRRDLRPQRRRRPDDDHRSAQPGRHEHLLRQW
jgi:YD repeat-containing protein